MEADICGLVISIDVRVDQMLLGERDGERAFLSKGNRLSASGRVASSQASRSTREPEVDGIIDGALRAAGADPAPVDARNAVSAAMCKEAMPEMLRLREYFGR